MTAQRTRVLGGGASREAPVLPPGERIGAWIVQRVVGGGGFGRVYEVRHSEYPRRAALKLLHLADPALIRRFDREIEALRRLQHPNVVRLVDAGVSTDGRPYLCMELIEGEELGALLARTRGLPHAEVRRIFGAVCAAIESAHDAQIIHRDIKASNILLDGDRVVVVDFGIAKLCDSVSELTSSQQAIGTPATMAPEQILGRPIDARTDIYALGALLFHMLTGKVAFDDLSPTMSQYLHVHARRPQISHVVRGSRRLDAVVTRAMAVDPADRYRDVRTLAAAAAAGLDDAMADVRPVPCVGFFVRASYEAGTSLDASLCDALEAAVPRAADFFAQRGVAAAVDLGSSAIFVARRDAVADPTALADELWRELVAHRDPRVRIGVAVQPGVAELRGDELQSSALLDLQTWSLPPFFDGRWPGA